MDRVRRLSYKQRHPEPQVAVATRSLMSAKNLDFVSLAICSCVLTLLCHSAAHLPQSSSNLKGAAPQPSNSAPGAQGAGFQPFTLAAGRPEIKEEES